MNYQQFCKIITYNILDNHSYNIVIFIFIFMLHFYNIVKLRKSSLNKIVYIEVQNIKKNPNISPNEKIMKNNDKK